TAQTVDGGSFMMGLLTGAGVGVGLGLLLDPNLRSGSCSYRDRRVASENSAPQRIRDTRLAHRSSAPWAPSSPAGYCGMSSRDPSPQPSPRDVDHSRALGTVRRQRARQFAAI